MSDFEVHQRGTATEIRLYRELVSTIAEEMETYGEGIFSHGVKLCYNRVNRHVVEMMEDQDE